MMVGVYKSLIVSLTFCDMIKEEWERTRPIYYWELTVMPV